MTAITVTYQMPDDLTAFNHAHHATAAWVALSDIDQHCRNHLKHGDPPDAEKAIEHIRSLALEALRSIE